MVNWLPPVLGLWLAAAGVATAGGKIATPVSVREDNRSLFLENGIVSVTIAKASGNLTSLKYQGLELLAQKSAGGALGGYWSSVERAAGGSQKSNSLRINPLTNGGERAEVSCHFHNPPGIAAAPLDVDIRYSLGRGESWVYTSLVWVHRPGYPPLNVSEARFALKLNPAVFDFLTIDRERRRLMPAPEDWDQAEPLNLKEARRLTTGIHRGEVEYKYDYSAVLYDLPAYGWSSTTHNVGLWFINPSFEYLAGGPAKVELTGHLDVNPGGTPTLLNMWLGSHYGGSSLVVARDEAWTKVVGPFVIYCNAARPAGVPDERETSTPPARGPAHQAGGYAVQTVLWADALARAKAEAARWPYDWVNDTNYPAKSQRSIVAGQILCRDPLEPDLKLANMWVGLTAANYVPPRSGDDMRRGFPAEVDWQRDGKFFQFWARADDTGRFSLPNVRPGDYTLRAIADGVIGEFARARVTVSGGQLQQLGALTWQPVRHGRTLWQIGEADRTAREFRHGDDYWHWGLYFQYPREFPKGVNYIIGRSQPRRDWNYVQPPLPLTTVPAKGDEEEILDQLARAVRGPDRQVQPTTWTITFALNQRPHGRATLRLAFCGTHAGCKVEVFVNGQSVGDTGLLPATSAMQRDGIRAFWVERPITFEASLMKGGVNVIQLKSRATSWSQGVMYDVVRLELDEPGPIARK